MERTRKAAHRAKTEAPAQGKNEQTGRLGSRDCVTGGGDETRRGAAAYQQCRCHGTGQQRQQLCAERRASCEAHGREREDGRERRACTAERCLQHRQHQTPGVEGTRGDRDGEAGTKHSVALLDLSPDQWLSLADLQAVSTESIGGVTVKDMMTVLRGSNKTVSKTVVDKVNIWKETGRISLVKEASMPAPVLVIQATMQRVESEDDHTRVLVPYIPPDTDIALTTLEDLYDKVKDTPAWLKRSLRNDLMLMAHELNFHAVPRNMVKQLRQLVMWPSLIADCRNHVGACRKCLQALKLLRSVGVSLQELGRFRKAFMDVWHFPQSVKKRTGHMGCLTMCDAAGGLTRYIAIKTESAEACAMVIITHWIAVFGLMEELWSDNASAFAGEVMELICNMLGVKKKFAAVGDSRKVGMAETRHNSVKTVVMQAVSDAEIRTAEDLYLIMAFAEMKVNQLTPSSAESVFELYFAQPPITVFDTIQTQGPLPAFKLKHKPADKVLIQGVHKSIRELLKLKNTASMDDHALTKEHRSRATVMHRDIVENSKAVTRCDLRSGDKVSLAGKEVVLDSTSGSSPERPITATVVPATGVKKQVKFESLKPVGTLRVQRTLPRLHKVDVDQFVIYEEEDRSFAGKVTSSAEDKFVVHDWGPHEKQRDKFLPLWLMEGSAEAQRGPLEQPTGARPHLTAVPQTHLILVGELDEKTNRLTQLTRDALSARGIDL